ncbi:MAG: hypothetical protein LBM25_00125 [Bacteroidales bacterium]|jgi:glucose-1-phosphate thymidylyltransferase|nr:hypothetical protein [Bacteroidales bacterium]
MNIIIPMAGMGTRMRPHTLTTPKPLIPIAGKSIVERLCEDIVEVCDEKVEEIGFIVGRFGKKVEESLIGIANNLGAKGRIYYQDEPLGTAHAVFCAKESLFNKVIVAFSDTLFDAQFKLKMNNQGIIWTHKVEDPSAFGVVKKDEKGLITAFVEKPKEFVSNEAIIGIYYFEDGAFLKKELEYLIENNLSKGGEFLLTDALDNMLIKGLRFSTQSVEKWLDCGNKDATVNTNRVVLDLKYEKENMANYDNSLIRDTTIIPPCYIGRNVRISNSKIGPYVSIGEGTIVEGSTIENAMIQTNTKIKDSNIENSMIGNYVVVEKINNEVSLGDYSTITFIKKSFK